MKDLSDIVCAIAGPLTQRTLENLRRALEEMYVKSTAQDVSPTEANLFTPELIGQAHESARRDNARMIVDWAQAIYEALQAAESSSGEPDYISELKKRLLYAREKERSLNSSLADIKAGRAYPTLPAEARQRQAEVTERALRQTQEDLLNIEQDLRDLRELQTPVLGHPPYQGATGSESAGYDELDGHLPRMSPEDS